MPVAWWSFFSVWLKNITQLLVNMTLLFILQNLFGLCSIETSGNLSPLFKTLRKLQRMYMYNTVIISNILHYYYFTVHTCIITGVRHCPWSPLGVY